MKTNRIEKCILICIIILILPKLFYAQNNIEDSLRTNEIIIDDSFTVVPVKYKFPGEEVNLITRIKAAILDFLFIFKKDKLNFINYQLTDSGLVSDTIENQVLLKFNNRIIPDTIKSRIGNVLGLDTSKIHLSNFCMCNDGIYLLNADRDSGNLEENLQANRQEIGHEFESYNYYYNFPYYNPNHVQQERFSSQYPEIQFFSPKKENAPDDTQMEYFTKPKKRVKIALIDGGINPDYKNKFTKNFNIKRNRNHNSFNHRAGNENRIPNQHGTFVADIITRGRFFKRNIELMDINVFDSNGKSSLLKIICGIYAAIENDVDIINMSFGYYSQTMDTLLFEAISKAAEKNITIIASAGNNQNNNDIKNHYPSHFSHDTMRVNNIISVAAKKTGNKELKSYSNYGNATVDVATIGDHVLIFDDIIIYGSGTSFSVPKITKTAAKLIAKNIDASSEEIIKCIIEKAKYKGYPLISKSKFKKRKCNNCFSK